MNVLDWIIIIWLVIAFLTGARLGLVYRLGHAVGFVVGLWLAIQYQDSLAAWFGGGPFSRITTFVSIMVAVAEASGFVALLLDKFFRIFSWLPFVKSANALLGGAIGVIGHAAIISVALYFASQYVTAPVFVQTVGESTLGSWCFTFGSWLATFIPYV